MSYDSESFESLRKFGTEHWQLENARVESGAAVPQDSYLVFSIHPNGPQFPLQQQNLYQQPPVNPVNPVSAGWLPYNYIPPYNLVYSPAHFQPQITSQVPPQARPQVSGNLVYPASHGPYTFYQQDFSYANAATQFSNSDSSYSSQPPCSIPPTPTYNKSLSPLDKMQSRGPPLKPQRTGYAVWVGSIPDYTNVLQLRDHFARNPSVGCPQSVFLLDRRHCAFINYKTSDECLAMIRIFNNCLFNGARLQCRLRRLDSIDENDHELHDLSETNADSDNSAKLDAQHSASEDDGKTTSSSTQDSDLPSNQSERGSRLDQEIVASEEEVLEYSRCTSSQGTLSVQLPERFFILKSLTITDLERSMRSGVWATQSRNEKLLQEAFEKSEKVYLIFSANKSGAYCGFARMTSAISSIDNKAFRSHSISQNYLKSPTAVSTTATSSAPQGYIMDDRERGSIFWEAKSSESTLALDNDVRSFGVEWISTKRVPFSRTRGLFNPWNENKEIKVARDGTEIETKVGRQLIQLFL